LARLWNQNIKHVYELIKEMKRAGKWSDKMVKPGRTTWVDADAFEEFLQERGKQ
jgi:hypothetical protein